MALSKEVKVGLLALVAGVILYIGFNYLKGIDFFSPTKKYFVVYDNVGGLTVSNAVTLSGMPVGRVDEMTLLINRNNKILVTLEIDDQIKIGDGTSALLKNSSLLGGKEILLVLGPNTKIYGNGDTIRGTLDKDKMEELTNRATPVIDKLDSLTGRFNTMLNDKFSKDVQMTMSNLKDATGDLKETLKENRSKINNMTTNFSQLSTSLLETQKRFGPIIDNFKQISDTLKDLRLKQVIDSASLAMNNLKQVTQKINSKEGTLGMLIHDKALYNNLNRSINHLTYFVDYLNYNPKHYFKPFGRKANKDSIPPVKPQD